MTPPSIATPLRSRASLRRNARNNAPPLHGSHDSPTVCALLRASLYMQASPIIDSALLQDCMQPYTLQKKVRN